MRPADLPLKYRLLLSVYPWRRAERVAAATLRRSLAQARVALVTSAGLVAPGDLPFDLSLKGGDWSYRVIRADADLRTLIMHHRSGAFDPAPIAADRNVAFPLDRLRELAARGVIGSVAPRHLSFMGSITAPGRLRAQSAPEAAEHLVADGVDVALLVPVWPMCHQTVSLVQVELERRGIVTASLSVMPDVTRRLAPPRALVVDAPLGAVMGAPHDVNGQTAVLERLLALTARLDVPVLEEV